MTSGPVRARKAKMGRGGIRVILNTHKNQINFTWRPT